MLALSRRRLGVGSSELTVSGQRGGPPKDTRETQTSPMSGAYCAEMGLVDIALFAVSLTP